MKADVLSLLRCVLEGHGQLSSCAQVHSPSNRNNLIRPAKDQFCTDVLYKWCDFNLAVWQIYYDA